VTNGAAEVALCTLPNRTVAKHLLLSAMADLDQKIVIASETATLPPLRNSNAVGAHCTGGARDRTADLRVYELQPRGRMGPQGLVIERKVPCRIIRFYTINADDKIARPPVVQECTSDRPLAIRK
jgi:hypothetical protein